MAIVRWSPAGRHASKNKLRLLLQRWFAGHPPDGDSAEE
jgi:hypothetical protein